MTNIRDYSENVNQTLKSFSDHNRAMQPTSYITSILQNGIENRSGAYNCEKCFKSFKTKQKLNHHMDSHDETKKFICDFPNCDRRYKSSPLLKNHKKSHKEPMNRNNFPGDQNSFMNKSSKFSNDGYHPQSYYQTSQNKFPNINQVIDCSINQPSAPLPMHLENVPKNQIMGSYPAPDNTASYGNKSYPQNSLTNTMIDYPNVANGHIQENYYPPSQQVRACSNNNQHIDPTRLPFYPACYPQLDSNTYDTSNFQYPPYNHDPSMMYNNPTAGYPDLVNENYSHYTDNFPQQKVSTQDWKQHYPSSIPDEYINNSTPLSSDNNNGRHSSQNSAFQFNNSNSVNSNSTNSSIMNNTSFGCVMSPLTPNHGLSESTADRFEEIAFNIGCKRGRVDSNPSITLNDIVEIISNDLSASSGSTGTQPTLTSLEDQYSPSKDFNAIYYDNQICHQMAPNVNYNLNTSMPNQLPATAIMSEAEEMAPQVDTTSYNHPHQEEAEDETEQVFDSKTENEYYPCQGETFYPQDSASLKDHTRNGPLIDHQGPMDDPSSTMHNQSPPIIK